MSVGAPAPGAPPAAWVQLTIVEAKMVWRDPAGFILPIGMPLLILVMNGMGADPSGEAGLAGLRAFDAVVVPLTLAMVMTMIAVINMPAFLATYRKEGVLRRLSVTPVSPALVLVAQTVVALAQTALGIALALGVARFAFDLSPPLRPGWVVGALALAAVALFAVGMLVAAVAPSVNATIAIGLVAFLGMLALAGTFGGPEGMPDWLATLGAHTPFGAAAAALTQAWTGQVPDASHLLALGGVAAAAATAAAALFRWE